MITGIIRTEERGSRGWVSAATPLFEASLRLVKMLTRKLAPLRFAQTAGSKTHFYFTGRLGKKCLNAADTHPRLPQTLLVLHPLMKKLARAHCP